MKSLNYPTKTNPSLLTTPNIGLDEWRSHASIMRVSFEFDAPKPREFKGNIIEYDLGPIRVFDIIASAHDVHHPNDNRGAKDSVTTLVALNETGACKVSWNGDQHELKEGELTILHSETPFSLTFPSKMHQRVISIPAQALSYEMIMSRHLGGVSISCRNGVGNVLREFLNSILVNIEFLQQSQKEQLGQSLIEVLNAIARSELERIDKPLLDIRSYHIERIKTYINENLTDPDLSSGRVAEALGISLRYMNKVFENEKYTVRQRILVKRLSGAKADLINPAKFNKSVTDIAFFWGFSSASYFSRAYKAHFGSCPRDARQ